MRQVSIHDGHDGGCGTVKQPFHDGENRAARIEGELLKPHRKKPKKRPFHDGETNRQVYIETTPR
jgi:hypothetical protein